MSESNLNKEFLLRCQRITEKFEKDTGKWRPSQQILKMYEEVGEVHQDMINANLDGLMRETCDVILSAITMFNLLQCTPEQIQEVMEETLQKVELRCGLKKV
jgi:NTP pyrophosphatase (non-canonical NTP hydrolase)